jgi:hypothetical protein
MGQGGFKHLEGGRMALNCHRLEQGLPTGINRGGLQPFQHWF